MNSTCAGPPTRNQVSSASDWFGSSRPRSSGIFALGRGRCRGRSLYAVRSCNVPCLCDRGRRNIALRLIGPSSTSPRNAGWTVTKLSMADSCSRNPMLRFIKLAQSSSTFSASTPLQTPRVAYGDREPRSDFASLSTAHPSLLDSLRRTLPRHHETASCHVAAGLSQLDARTSELSAAPRSCTLGFMIDQTQSS